METIKINILNPKAMNLLKDMAALDLIKISDRKQEPDFMTFVKKLRAKSKDDLSLEEITKEVEEVRKARYEK